MSFSNKNQGKFLLYWNNDKPSTESRVTRNPKECSEIINNSIKAMIYLSILEVICIRKYNQSINNHDRPISRQLSIRESMILSQL